MKIFFIINLNTKRLNCSTVSFPLCFKKCSRKFPISWKHKGHSGNIEGLFCRNRGNLAQILESKGVGNIKSSKHKGQGTVFSLKVFLCRKITKFQFLVSVVFCTEIKGHNNVHTVCNILHFLHVINYIYLVSHNLLLFVECFRETQRLPSLTDLTADSRLQYIFGTEYAQFISFIFI